MAGGKARKLDIKISITSFIQIRAKRKKELQLYFAAGT
jgi:hypothetical protein